MTFVSIPKSDADDLDDVIRALGIEDSETTPSEAVAELLAEIERLQSFRASHDRLLAAAKEVIAHYAEPAAPLGSGLTFLARLQAAIAAAEEQAT